MSTTTTSRPGRETGSHVFDPVVVGHLECEAWASYYRRRWVRFLFCAVGMVHAAFGMSTWRTLRGAWLVLRANQFWAPADNDPDAARAAMRRFYELVRRSGRATFDPTHAAELEVEWWRVHRLNQHDLLDSSTPIVECLTELYGYLYEAEPAETRLAAEFRVLAMDLSDRWVADGHRPSDRLLMQERRALVDCYTELRLFIDRQTVTPL